LEIGGPNVAFTNYEQMFYARPGGKKSAKTMSFGFSLGERTTPDQVNLDYRLTNKELRLEKQVSYIDLLKEKVFLTQRPGALSEDEVAKLPEEVRQLGDRLSKNPNRAFEFRNVLSRGFLDLTLAEKSADNLGINAMSVSVQRYLRQALVNLIHIPGLRGNPQRDYLLRNTKGPRFDGLFQDYVAGIVAGWKKDDEIAALGESLRKLGLTWKVEARALDATRVEIMVGRLKGPRQGGAKDVVNIADVGFGVSQILPALVALQVAKKGQMVHLEQPEIHLHPRAQRGLAEILADGAKKGVRMVVETHSSILLLGIQTLIAEGKLDPNLVKLHWFSRNEETGATQVDSADLDENGAFGSDWPMDFDDTYLASERDYLNAVEQRNFG